ncbi:MAG: site-2 protease family protein [Chthoniobacterales bacterium]|nr:site-2 protease family protein [Chthoniobacterales bacterium]
MKWSFSIGKVADIDIRIHITFLLLLLLVGWSSYQNDGLIGAWAGISFILLLFGCVLLHELGHAFAARAFGIRTPDITLLPIGGVARLEKMPRNPIQELVIAAAGPVVNVVIAIGLYWLIGRNAMFWSLEGFEVVGPGQILVKLLLANVYLVLFNLLPAFPMDGGRVLRATLAVFLRYDRATDVAAFIGQLIAIVLFALSVLWGQLLLGLISIFVFLGARQEAVLAKIHEAMPANIPIRQAMITQFSCLPAEAPLWRAREYASQTMQTLFPVVREDLRCVGVLSREELMQPADSVRDLRPISQEAKPVLEIFSDEPYLEAVEKMETGGHSVAAVVNENRQLVGLVTLAALLERGNVRR